MGLAAAGALVSVAMAFLLLSPRFVTRIGLGNRRLDARIRSLVGFSLALMLLALGFFLAGVPLGGPAASTSVELAPAGDTETTDGGEEAAVPLLAQLTPVPSLASTVSAVSTRTTGAFAGPLPTETGASASPPDELVASEGSGSTPVTLAPATATPGIAASATVESTSNRPSATPGSATASASPTVSLTPSSSPTASTTPTMTPTPEPTPTPTPTLTPTPIEGETAAINTSGSTLWVRRTPGGTPLALVGDRDIVILSSGHAHQGGVLWREVRTVAGVLGWVQEEFLTFGEET